MKKKKKPAMATPRCIIKRVSILIDYLEMAREDFPYRDSQFGLSQMVLLRLREELLHLPYGSPDSLTIRQLKYFWNHHEPIKIKLLRKSANPVHRLKITRQTKRRSPQPKVIALST
jgi:hypothetical protein